MGRRRFKGAGVPRPEGRRPAVFLDRDGTLIHEKNYISRPEQVTLYAASARALKGLKEAGFRLVLITNQSGVGRGYFGLDDVRAVHARLRELLRAEGADLDAVYVCPHAPSDGCSCRKPSPGLVRRALRDHPIRLGGSYVVGDRARDVSLGKRLGLTAVLVRTGYGRRAESGPKPDHTAPHIGAAARWIIARSKDAAAGLRRGKSPRERI